MEQQQQLEYSTIIQRWNAHMELAKLLSKQMSKHFVICKPAADSSDLELKEYREGIENIVIHVW